MNRKHKAQKSKVQRDNEKLSKMIDRYYSLNFDIISIRRELKTSDNIFSNQALSRKNEAMN